MVNKQTRIYEVLRTGILTGVYRPGDRLVISALAADLKVSAVPVREAIRRLEAEGLVVYTHNAGARVAPVEADEFLDGMASLGLLEGYATALAVGRVDVELLRAKTAAMHACMERLDVGGFARANNEFHAAIYDVCPNPYLRDLMRDISERLQTIRTAVFGQVPYRGVAAIREHETLVELIAQPAPATSIEAAAREHKLATVAAFREALAGEAGYSAVVGSR